jgi:demethylmenaquinone methyltransferase/2-methoxy-6-polyprenyl-1,4-benzoquinol methylase
VTSAPGPLIDYYAKRAHEYERVYRKPERQEDLHQLRALVKRSFAGKTVLEIACGTGYWTECLSEVARAVTAIDANDEVLEIARLKPLDWKKVILRRADAYDLSTLPAEFDAAFAGFWWSHIPRSRLAEFLGQLHHKLLRGRMVFLDNAYVEGSSTRVSRIDSDGNTYQIRCLDDGSQFEVLKNFPTDQELRTALAPHCESLRIDRLQYYWCVSGSLRAPIQSTG